MQCVDLLKVIFLNSLEESPKRKSGNLRLNKIWRNLRFETKPLEKFIFHTIFMLLLEDTSPYSSQGVSKITPSNIL